jgi:citrate lyase subunit beta/citryl-CoA lyase
MRLRSLLFVPGDRPELIAKAAATAADALILDLEDSVVAGRKPVAREVVAKALQSHRPMPFFVRVNPLDSGFIAEDMAAIAPHRPDGWVLPKTEGAASVTAFEEHLMGAGDNKTPILPIVTETPAAMFALGSYVLAARRLCGLTWGAEDLSAAVGAVTAREDNGDYTAPYQLVRSLTLFSAHAAGVAAIETIYPGFRDLEGLERYARRGRRDGFTGMMAIHPGQIATINAAFMPSADEIAWARRVVAAFADKSGAGAIALDGKMLDGPHRKQAEDILEAASLAENPHA